MYYPTKFTIITVFYVVDFTWTNEYNNWCIYVTKKIIAKDYCNTYSDEIS